MFVDGTALLHTRNSRLSNNFSDSLLQYSQYIQRAVPYCCKAPPQTLLCPMTPPPWHSSGKNNTCSIKARWRHLSQTSPWCSPRPNRQRKQTENVPQDAHRSTCGGARDVVRRGDMLELYPPPVLSVFGPASPDRAGSIQPCEMAVAGSCRGLAACA